METDVRAALDALEASANYREAVRCAVSGLFSDSIRGETKAAAAQERHARWTENPAAAVPSINHTIRVEVVSNVDLARLLAAAEIYQEAYLRSYFTLGFREAELVHTRYGDDLSIDLRDWWVQEREPDPCCPCKRCQTTGWMPKTVNGTRHVPVPPKVRDAIARYLQLFPVRPGGYAFRNPRTGRLWNLKSLQEDFKRLCARAEVTYGSKVAGGITIHTLRHTCATNLVRAKQPVSYIAKILGDTEETIMKTYIHPQRDDLSDAIDQAAALMP